MAAQQLPKKIFNGVSWVLDDTLKVTKVHAEAQDLHRENDTDVTWAVTLIGRAENRIEDVVGEVGYFNTGLKLTPPAHHHLEVVARPNLHKLGYEIPSGTIVLQPSSTNELIVPLRKVHEGQDLELPYQAVDVIIRPSVYASLQGPKLKAPARRAQNDDEPAKSLPVKKGGKSHMF